MHDWHEWLRRINPHYEHAQARLKELLAKYPPKCSLALDAGCGDGGGSVLATTYETELVGVDISAGSLKNNMRVHHRVCCSIYRLPIRDDIFDLATSEWVVEHLESPRNAFTELNRILKPGGGIVVVTPNLNNPLMFIGKRLIPENVTKKFLRWLAKTKEEIPYPLRFRCNTFRELDASLAECGFERKIFATANYPFYFGRFRLLFRGYALFERICALLHFHVLDIYLIGLYYKKL